MRIPFPTVRTSRPEFVLLRYWSAESLRSGRKTSIEIWVSQRHRSSNGVLKHYRVCPHHRPHLRRLRCHWHSARPVGRSLATPLAFDGSIDYDASDYLNGCRIPMIRHIRVLIHVFRTASIPKDSPTALLDCGSQFITWQQERRLPQGNKNCA